MAELGPHLTLACPVCKAPVRVEITVIGHASSGGHVLAELDKSEADRHLAECVGKAPLPKTTSEVLADVDKVLADQPSTAVATTAPVVSPAELGGRISRMLDMRAYVTPGKRACMFCGTENATCLETLAGSHAACCNVCAEYDTHPVPHGDKSCAEWAVEHGAKN